MNAKTFFVVYTLGLDARVLTGKYQRQNFENFWTLQQLQLKISLQLLRHQLRQMNKYPFKNDIEKSMQSKSDQNCQCGYGETKVFELESKSSKPFLFLSRPEI